MPNRIATGITAVALTSVLVWSAQPMTGTWEYAMSGERRPSIRRPVAFEGFGAGELWGRWTTDDTAALILGRPLPERFVAVLHGHAFGPNIGAPVRVCVDGACETTTFAADDRDTRLSFRTDGGVRRMTIHVPHPTAPEAGDDRLLGVGLVFVRIEEAR